jgi:hypothetical protein
MREYRDWEIAQGIPERDAYLEARRRQELRDEALRGDEDPFLRAMRQYGGGSTYNLPPSRGGGTINPVKKEATE